LAKDKKKFPAQAVNVGREGGGERERAEASIYIASAQKKSKKSKQKSCILKSGQKVIKMLFVVHFYYSLVR
jgi:hypothetical protein